MVVVDKPIEAVRWGVGTEGRLVALIASLAGREYVAEVEAAKFVESESRDHRDDFLDWLEGQAEDIVRRIIVRRVGEQRRDVIRNASKRRFAAAEEEAANGDATALIAVAFVVDENQTRRPLGKMTAPDCYFAARVQEASVAYRLMVAAFLKALGRKVEESGKDRVEDVMGEAELRRLLDSFNVVDLRAV